MNPVLKIDPEYEAICPSLTDEELEQLEENIVSEGIILTPLIVWDGVIIDGHNRYKIAQEHPGIKFTTYEKTFVNRYEALSWICKNQLGRRNLTPMQKKYLVGQRYNVERMAHGASDGFRGNQHTELVRGQNCPLPEDHKTRKQIAEETGTTESYVKRADQYAKGIKAAEEVLPGIKNDLLIGKYRPKETDVAAIARASPEERREKVEKLKITPEEKKKAREEAQQSRKSKQTEEITRIYEEMKAPKNPIGEESILASMQAAVKTMIRVCNMFFGDYPSLLTEKVYKDKVIEIMQEPKQFINEIEGASL